MNALNITAIFVAAWLTVFAESYFNFPERLLSTRIDLLPALIVYASLSTGTITLSLLSIWGGLWFDALSGNPLGVSVLPLFVSGLGIYLCRDLILREQIYAQFVTGVAASAITPVLTLMLIFQLGGRPLLGWQSAWQWAVMTVVGGAMTPVWFFFFDRLNNAFNYQPLPESSFRTDREIKRGRN